MAGVEVYQGPEAPRRRGLIDWLRAMFNAWPGGRAAAAMPGVEQAVREDRVASGPTGVPYPWIAPYLDDVTGEPADARASYRLMWADPVVKAALLGKLLAVSHLDLKVTPYGGLNASPADRRAADLVRWNLTERLEGGFPGLVWSVLFHGCVDGVSVCEKVFAPERRGRWAGTWPLVKLKPKDVGHDVAIRTDAFRNVLDIQGLRYNGGKFFHPSKFLIFRHMPAFDSPVGTSDFRACYGSWWMRDTLRKIRAVAAEKRAIPFIYGKYGPTHVKAGLEAVLSNIKSQMWAAVPDTVQLEVLNIAGAADGIFESFTRDLTHEIFLSIQGATLQNLEGTTNSGRGDSAIHEHQAEHRVKHLAQCVEALLNDRESGLVRDIVDVNVAVTDYPTVSLTAVDWGEMRQRLDVLERVSHLVAVSGQDIYEGFGVQPPRGDADRAGGPPEPGAPAPPGATQSGPGVAE
jgi:hypothetical protein